MTMKEVESLLGEPDNIGSALFFDLTLRSLIGGYDHVLVIFQN
jgi:hypothetical protein